MPTCEDDAQRTHGHTDIVHNTPVELCVHYRTQMVGYYRKELADLGDIHEALLKLLLANVQ